MLDVKKYGLMVCCCFALTVLTIAPALAQESDSLQGTVRFVANKEHDKVTFTARKGFLKGVCAFGKNYKREAPVVGKASVIVEQEAFPKQWGGLRPTQVAVSVSHDNVKHLVEDPRAQYKNAGGCVAMMFGEKLLPSFLGDARPVQVAVGLEKTYATNKVKGSFSLSWVQKLWPTWLKKCRPAQTTLLYSAQGDYKKLKEGVKEHTLEGTVSFKKDLWPAFLKWLRPDKTNLKAVATVEGNEFTKPLVDASAAITYQLPGMYPNVTLECGEKKNDLRNNFMSAQFDFGFPKFLAYIKVTLEKGKKWSLGWNVSSDGVLGK